MSGHNALAGLGNAQLGTSFGGPFITTGDGTPATDGSLQIGPGGLYLRTDAATDQVARLYINIGASAAAPNWFYVQCLDGGL